ncbi:hypothetical protein BKG71_16595 [Mycobacteroides chelonae]|uniref:Uncharacterized protein n=1 Tax=Mycobacteroides chelonae TaxID=1774 RepID=A0AB73LPZ5_MYCCH|nr:hypothetical protein BKG63_21795 [Mycobacteroides chelonae]OHT55035.1 hypothetical protein BKG62_02260 [Mycobacteroides chelonae]OHT58326.1 hypothetical protein BKG64_16525 [Mycobacteroides chelonae]OHT64528.1 hypothetical protein BKG65_07660 [Mycobacteroides chelonae]OHT99397.1 hypothetical protein BKG72_02845 [Mycobacteroides chelonae]
MLGLAGALRFESVIFGGELIGATLGLQAAILAPERVTGLMLDRWARPTGMWQRRLQDRMRRRWPC